jgi:hypothetical protein
MRQIHYTVCLCELTTLSSYLVSICVRSDAARYTPPRRFRPRCKLPSARSATPATLAPSLRSPRTSCVRPTRLARHGHPSSCPHHVCVLPLLSHLSLSVSRPLTAERLLDLFPNPQGRRDALSRPPLSMTARRTCGDALGRSRLSQGHPQAQPDASGSRAPPAPTPMAGIDWPRAPLPCVVNVCLKCFRRFRGMLQLFHIDVAKVDQGCYICCICCKCFKSMLQAFC